MARRLRGVWVESCFTHTFHYQGRFVDNYNNHKSKCSKHKISNPKFDFSKKYSLKNIPRPDKICKECLTKLHLKLDFMDYITNIEEIVNGITPIIDFICNIKNIEIECK